MNTQSTSCGLQWPLNLLAGQNPPWTSQMHRAAFHSSQWISDFLIDLTVVASWKSWGLSGVTQWLLRLFIVVWIFAKILVIWLNDFCKKNFALVIYQSKKYKIQLWIQIKLLFNIWFADLLFQMMHVINKLKKSEGKCLAVSIHPVSDVVKSREWRDGE